MSSPDSISTHKRCLDCGYILDGLPENRCPECGKPFDPNDARTFDDGTQLPSAPLVGAVLGVVGLACGILGSVLLPANWTFRYGTTLFAFPIVGWLFAGRSLSRCVEYLRNRRSSQRGRATAVIVLDAAALLPLALLMAFFAFRLLLVALRWAA
jgi:hypothetical protein